jgi:hypothetical protein
LLRFYLKCPGFEGKSYLLATVFLWCILHDKNTRAAAPTGIAASNIEIEGTDVSAVTLHYLFDLDTDFKTKLDLSKLSNSKVADLMAMQVLLLDEVSMMDVDCWATIKHLLSNVDHSKRPTAHGGHAFGQVHVILFGDMKQLPPATSRPPFIATPSFVSEFDFRVLRQNRRLIGDASRMEELEEFHGILNDISWGLSTQRVRSFLIQAYVKGASFACAERVPVEGCTSVFNKRRYRDKWNRTVVRRIAKAHNHSLKIKGRVRARGARGQQWYSESRASFLQRKVRTQALWNLHLAGDWHKSSETKTSPLRPHLMRVMLVANLAVDMRFANGTQGRLLHWSPRGDDMKKALSASHPELLARFAKESALSRPEMLPDVHHIDVIARPENLATVRGEPVLLQLCVVPAYALTVHKVQALSITHLVIGCVEGCFAQGQLYVLISRVTDPQNLVLCGVPPEDLFDDLAAALEAQGLDVDEFFRRACSTTEEWIYTPASAGSIRARVTPKWIKERTIPPKLRTTSQVLNPQPLAQEVIHKLLDWIDRVDTHSQDDTATRGPRPPFATPTGESIFPPEDVRWWLTDVQKLASETPDCEGQIDPGDEDGAASQEEEPNVYTDDEDPLSEPEGDEGGGLGRAPALGWRSGAAAPRREPSRTAMPPSITGRPPASPPPPPSPVLQYNGYFERQVRAECGRIALNNALGGPHHTVEDMTRAVDEYLRASLQEGFPEVRAQHEKPTGWYSSEVLAQALTTTAMFRSGRVTCVMPLEPLRAAPTSLCTAIGAVVNIDNLHWVALRYVDEQVWLLDSQNSRPVPYTWQNYLCFIRVHPDAYRIEPAIDMHCVPSSAGPNLGRARVMVTTAAPTADEGTAHKKARSAPDGGEPTGHQLAAARLEIGRASTPGAQSCTRQS